MLCNNKVILKERMKKKLILESGEVFHGEGFGAEVDTAGEVVFNTGMTGYQELLSDPSYCGQIVCMTYPLIGNYGINRDDYESIEPAMKGLIVKELCDLPSNFRTQMTLDELFKKKNLSARSYDRIIKVSRTIADLDCAEGIHEKHIAEAIQLRNDVGLELS